MTNLWEMEQGCFDEGIETVCGVDEAGRGTPGRTGLRGGGDSAAPSGACRASTIPRS